MKKLFAAVVVLMGLLFMACQKEYSIENETDLTSIGTWEFKDSANTLYTGNPIQYYIDDTTDPTSAHLVYTGATANLSGSISIEIYFPTDTAKIGSYSSALGQVSFLYQGAGKLFKVDAFAGQFSNENITVNLTTVTDTSVTGTFSGRALDSSGTRTVIVKDGKFTYKRRSTGGTTTPNISAGTLGTATDTCTGAIVSGSYKKGVAMGNANTVTVTANVTAAGTYTIYSDTLKGIYFMGTGTFTTTGAQSVVIPALGTPTDSGTVRFRIRYGTSNCTFQVKIDTAATTTIPPTGDYYPLTANSNWSYDIYDQFGTYQDSSYVKSTGNTITLIGNPYTIFVEDNDSSYWRKGNGLYYQADDLSGFIGTTTNTYQQTIMLKDNVPSGSTWADSVNVTYSGQAGKLKLNYTITAKAVAATISGLTYPDVIKVTTVYTVTPNILPIPVTIGTLEKWYARGTGNIYQKYTDNTTTPISSVEFRLRRSQIF